MRSFVRFHYGPDNKKSGPTVFNSLSAAAEFVYQNKICAIKTNDPPRAASIEDEKGNCLIYVGFN